MSTSRIAVLAPDVADRIAAGEVVERPASVVKELIENALDAGATHIDLEVRDGGRALIRVSDDGGGMTREEATLAIARHATSKIRDAEDLVGVTSFGFRGEALPAIGSVSHLHIETATGDGAGTRVEVSGGTVVAVKDAARRRGTTVSVEALFYNTPARQKFLKGARSEWRATLDLLHTIALVRRDVRLTVTHDGKEQLTLAAARTLADRVAALWGADTADRMVAVNDIQGIVASLRDRGIGVLISDHNVEQTLDIVDRAYIMFEGQVKVSGPVRELIFDDTVSTVYLGPTLTARLRARFTDGA